jgi:transcriptional regulator with XRE-family HTH domain
MTVPGVSRLESGKHFPSLATLVAVAEALGVGPCKLLEEAKLKRGKKK